MNKKTVGVFLWLLEYGALVLLCLGVRYSTDYTFRFLVLYMICQALFGHYQVKTILIWDEIRLLILSHICFFATSLILLPTMYITFGLVVKNALVTCFMLLFDIIAARTIRLILNRQIADRVMIVGIGKEAKTLATVCSVNRFSLMNVKCFLNPHDSNEEHDIEELKRYKDFIYPVEQLEKVLVEQHITEVILADPQMNQDVVDEIVNKANHYVKKIKYMPLVRGLITFDSRIEDFDGVLVVSRSIEHKGILKHFAKRLIDICAGIAGCLLVIPLTLYVRHVNRKNGDFDPVYFKQERIGKDGKMFVMYKFRTMIPNAEETLKKLMENDPAIREEYTTNKKLRNDPRITEAGKLLRRRSLDEFPQFINVLKGDMSLVGPRPYLPGEKDDMGIYYDSVIGSKPGITGMWQSHGRNDVGFHERCIMDDYYYRNWSLWLDITILIKTVKSVFVKDGAF